MLATEFYIMDGFWGGEGKITSLLFSQCMMHGEDESYLRNSHGREGQCRYCKYLA